MLFLGFALELLHDFRLIINTAKYLNSNFKPLIEPNTEVVLKQIVLISEVITGIALMDFLIDNYQSAEGANEMGSRSFWRNFASRWKIGY